MFVKTFLEWAGLSRRPLPPPEIQPVQPAVTGDRVIEGIVEAIALDQSVLLMGPRGCGKSWCVEQAITRATLLGHLPDEAADPQNSGSAPQVKPAMVFLQGNREIPRDYLAEDELEFKLVSGGTADAVVPKRRSAPLFRFAERDQNGDFATDADGALVWRTRNGLFKPGQRFALFLDEINRFSDGVLDSLLSILEEKRAVLAGKTYSVPVVVCMTMNPPGYDATAKNLSPPLAARIGRTIRLSTPDLDTLSDEIVVTKLDRVLGSSWTTTAMPGQATVVPMTLLRGAALTTLCMWGSPSLTRPGLQYLTPETLSLLQWTEAISPPIRSLMLALGRMSQYGPDGRAAGDWLISALAIARAEAADLSARQKVQAVPILQDYHLIDSAITSLSHKTVDNFSAASRPDLTARKEHLVRTLADEILRNTQIQQRLSRAVDELSDPIFALLSDFGIDPQVGQRCFWKSRATSAQHYACISELFKGNRPSPLPPDKTDQVAAFLGLLVAEAQRNQRAHDLERLERLRATLGRPSDYFLGLQLRSLPFVSEVIGTERFTENVQSFPRDRVLVIADHLDEVWRTHGPHAARDGLALLKRDLTPAERAVCKALLQLIVQEIELPEEPEAVGVLSRLLQRVRPAQFSQEERILRVQRKRLIDISNGL